MFNTPAEPIVKWTIIITIFCCCCCALFLQLLLHYLNAIGCSIYTHQVSLSSYSRYDVYVSTVFFVVRSFLYAHFEKVFLLPSSFMVWWIVRYGAFFARSLIITQLYNHMLSFIYKRFVCDGMAQCSTLIATN